MAIIPATEPLYTIKDLIATNFDKTNTTEPTLDVEIFPGWYVARSQHPQISFSSPREWVVDGGNTGVTGLRGNGDPHRVIHGELEVNIWVTREVISGNPKSYRYSIRRECDRICNTNTQVGELNHIAWVFGDDETLTDMEPTVFRNRSNIVYSYLA